MPAAPRAGPHLAGRTNALRLASFAANRGDVFTSMPKCFIDLLFATCIYASGEAFAVGPGGTRSHIRARAHRLHPSDWAHKIANSLLTVLPFVIRLLQCARQIWAKGGKTSDGRQPLMRSSIAPRCWFNSSHSLAGATTRPRTTYGSLPRITLFAFSWDVLIDWGLGPQPLRRAVRHPHSFSAKGRRVYGRGYWLRVVGYSLIAGTS